MAEINVEKLALCVFDTVMDDIVYEGNTIREWIGILKDRMPRLLTLEEVQGVGRDNWDAPSGEDIDHESVCLQDGRYIHMALPTYHYRPEWGDTEEDNVVRMEFFGSDHAERYECVDYGRTWRCWTAKPSKEQMETLWCQAKGER